MVTPAVSANIARYLGEMAAQRPNQAALKIPRGRTARGDIDYLSLSFSELDAEVDTWCERLTREGIDHGDRTLVMVKQGLPLIAAVFALFKIGAVPVVIDPGMGLKNFLSCVERSRPRALVGIPLAIVVSHVFRRAFQTVTMRVRAGASLTARLGPGSARSTKTPARVVAGGELAAILFTSGSTGSPKGVCYEHGMFDAQVRLIRETYAIQPGEIDLPMLPIFALFNPALGMTTIVPEIDPRRPAAVDPTKIVQAILQEKVTNSFGSPTLWAKIAGHCVNENLTLPTLRRVLCAGAPVPEKLWTQSRHWMPHGLLHSPYGATEALPVATISSDEIRNVRGIGACVGKPVTGIEVRIIGITDRALAHMEDARELPRGEIGEIIATGPVVTVAYDAAPDAMALAKITGSKTWHRMGDCGYLDSDGRLWFCGRKVERVITSGRTLFTEPCEQIFRAHPRVNRCALIGLGPHGQQRAAIVIEAAKTDARSAANFANELRSLARANAETKSITRFYFHPLFPVDVRHNAKIHRLTLAKWAEKAEAFDTE